MTSKSSSIASGEGFGAKYNNNLTEVEDIIARPGQKAQNIIEEHRADL